MTLKIRCFLIFSLFIALNCDAQDEFPDFTKMIDSSTIVYTDDTHRNQLAFSLINQANIFLCEKDTFKAIAEMKMFIDSFPNSGTDRLVRNKLGNLYLELGEYFKAESMFISTLETTILPNSGLFNPKENPNCKPIILVSDFRMAFADANIGLYQAALLQNQNEKALKYLEKADTAAMVSSDCGNGIMQNMFFVESYFPRYYANVGDTANAIKTGLRIILSEDETRLADKNTAFVKQLLLTKYTIQEIEQEIEHGISKMYEEVYFDNGKQYSRINLVMFGHKIDAIVFFNSNVEQTKLRIRSLKSLKILQNTAKY